MPLHDQHSTALLALGTFSLAVVLYVAYSRTRRRNSRDNPPSPKQQIWTDSEKLRAKNMLLADPCTASALPGQSGESAGSHHPNGHQSSAPIRGGRQNFRALKRGMEPTAAYYPTIVAPRSDDSQLRAVRLAAEFQANMSLDCDNRRMEPTSASDEPEPARCGGSHDENCLESEMSRFTPSLAPFKAQSGWIDSEEGSSLAHTFHGSDNRIPQHIEIDNAVDCANKFYNAQHKSFLCEKLHTHGDDDHLNAQNSALTSYDGRSETAKSVTRRPAPKTNKRAFGVVSSSESKEGSQDSGKGASVAPTSSFSPLGEGVETPLVYEFEIPQNIVGLIIGRQGFTIKQFTEQSGAQMIIRRHFASDDFKICTVEGQRDQINACLRSIRRKFPSSRFPELKLTPVMPAPIIFPVAPMVDAIVRLNLPIGVECEVVVSSLIEPDHFFVQQPTHPSFASLARLDQYMLAVYNQPTGVPCLPRPIESGVICAAPVMDGWFRAQTVEIFHETDEILVKFIDYGGFSKIAANDLRQIRSDFMTLPFQAIECTLANVKPVNENKGWTLEATAFFERCIHGKVVDAMVVGSSPNACVALIELFYSNLDSKGQRKTVNINDSLVENGFAKRIGEAASNLHSESEPFSDI